MIIQASSIRDPVLIIKIQGIEICSEETPSISISSVSLVDQKLQYLLFARTLSIAVIIDRADAL